MWRRRRRNILDEDNGEIKRGGGENDRERRSEGRIWIGGVAREEKYREKYYFKNVELYNGRTIEYLE